MAFTFIMNFDDSARSSLICSHCCQDEATGSTVVPLLHGNSAISAQFEVA